MLKILKDILTWSKYMKVESTKARSPEAHNNLLEIAGLLDGILGRLLESPTLVRGASRIEQEGKELVYIWRKTSSQKWQIATINSLGYEGAQVAMMLGFLKPTADKMLRGKYSSLERPPSLKELEGMINPVGVCASCGRVVEVKGENCSHCRKPIRLENIKVEDFKPEGADKPGKTEKKKKKTGPKIEEGIYEILPPSTIFFIDPDVKQYLCKQCCFNPYKEKQTEDFRCRDLTECPNCGMVDPKPRNLEALKPKPAEVPSAMPEIEVIPSEEPAPSVSKSESGAYPSGALSAAVSEAASAAGNPEYGDDFTVLEKDEGGFDMLEAPVEEFESSAQVRAQEFFNKRMDSVPSPERGGYSMEQPHERYEVEEPDIKMAPDDIEFPDEFSEMAPPEDIVYDGETAPPEDFTYDDETPPVEDFTYDDVSAGEGVYQDQYPDQMEYPREDYMAPEAGGMAPPELYTEPSHEYDVDYRVESSLYEDEGLVMSPWPVATGSGGRTSQSAFSGPLMGRVKWSVKLTSNLNTPPVLGPDSTIFLGTVETGFIKIGNDGKMLWRFKLSSPVLTSALIGLSGRIYFGTHSKFFCLNPDGSPRWVHRNGCWHSPLMDNDENIYVVSQTEVYCLHREGHLKWNFSLGEAGVLGFDLRPAMDQQGNIYVTTESLNVLNREGKLINRIKLLGEATPPTIDANGRVYLGEGGTLKCFRAEGTTLWQFEVNDLITTPPAVSGDGCVAFGVQEEPYLYYLTPRGEKKWKYNVGDPVLGTPVIDSNGHAFCLTKGSKIYAISSEGQQLWQLSGRAFGFLASTAFNVYPALGEDNTMYVTCLDGRLIAIE